MKWFNVFNLLKYRKRLLEYDYNNQKAKLNIEQKKGEPHFRV